jgi:hypothetical protein
LDGFVFYYNYFRPHESLDNRTPAEVAGIKSPYQDWASVLRLSVPKVESHAEDTLKPRTYTFKMDSRNFTRKSKAKSRHRKAKYKAPSIQVTATLGYGRMPEL